MADILEGATPGAPPRAQEYVGVAEEVAEYASLTPAQMAKKIKDLEFEQAAAIRDRIRELRGRGIAA